MYALLIVGTICGIPLAFSAHSTGTGSAFEQRSKFHSGTVFWEANESIEQFLHSKALAFHMQIENDTLWTANNLHIFVNHSLNNLAQIFAKTIFRLVFSTKNKSLHQFKTAAAAKNDKNPRKETVFHTKWQSMLIKTVFTMFGRIASVSTCYNNC